MRKATIIFILVAFIGSIMIVNFFGLKIKVYNQYVYVNNIDVTEDSLKSSPGLEITSFRVDDKNVIYIDVDYDESYKEKTGKDQVLMIIPHCYPDNANDKNVRAIYEGSYKDNYIIEENIPIPTITYNFTEERLTKIKSKTSAKETITIYLVNDSAGDSVKRKIKLTTHIVSSTENN